jgi:hypothetical protein
MAVALSVLRPFIFTFVPFSLDAFELVSISILELIYDVFGLKSKYDESGALPSPRFFGITPPPKITPVFTSPRLTLVGVSRPGGPWADE